MNVVSLDDSCEVLCRFVHVYRRLRVWFRKSAFCQICISSQVKPLYSEHLGSDEGFVSGGYFHIHNNLSGPLKTVCYSEVPNVWGVTYIHTYIVTRDSSSLVCFCPAGCMHVLSACVSFFPTSASAHTHTHARTHAHTHTHTHTHTRTHTRTHTTHTHTHTHIHM